MSRATELPAGVSGRSAIDVARALAREAGDYALSRFRQPQEVSAKGRGNLLSESDLAVERLLHESIKAEFPNHAILSEETATETSLDGWAWIVDPIDGTRNFVSGVPFFCVNLALCRDGVPVVAVTHDPNHDEAFWAERGNGAWLNDAPIRVSDAGTVTGSVLGIDLGYSDERGGALLRMLVQLFPGVQSIRIPGSAALGLAYAAAARYDLFVHHFLYPWDLAAGILLVEEAGGAITDHLGAAIDVRSQTVICGSRAACEDFLAWQKQHERELELPPPGHS